MSCPAFANWKITPTAGLPTTVTASPVAPLPAPSTNHPRPTHNHNSAWFKDRSLDICPKNTELREKAQRGTEISSFFGFSPLSPCLLRVLRVPRALGRTVKVTCSALLNPCPSETLGLRCVTPINNRKPTFFVLHFFHLCHRLTSQFTQPTNRQTHQTL
jgi:hypothetical protein